MKRWSDLLPVGRALQYTITQQLVELELDFFQWPSTMLPDLHEEQAAAHFNEYVLQNSQMTGIVTFPKLQSLSLTGIPMGGYEEIILLAFNLCSLKSLKLRSCPGWDTVLKRMTESNQRILLQSLEIQAYTVGESAHAGRDLAQFLLAFRGLKELYLNVKLSVNIWALSRSSSSLWQSVSQHASTLSRLIYHITEPSIYPLSGTMLLTTQRYKDETNFWLYETTDSQRQGVDQSGNPFCDLSLKCIGICVRLDYLVSNKKFPTEIFIKFYRPENAIATFNNPGVLGTTARSI